MNQQRTLSPSEARRFYDRFGARQDRQAWYEDPALDVLIELGRFPQAKRVFEYGCGTGRFAARLLREVLPAEAAYVGVDISSTMVELARRRLEPWADRAEVRLIDGRLPLGEADGSFDRLVSTYVLDLLGDEQIDAFLGEAHRLLCPDGLLLAAGITPGERGAARLVMRLWQGVFALSPKLLGGCRPLRLASRLDPRQWDVEHRRVVQVWGIASEVVAARRR